MTFLWFCYFNNLKAGIILNERYTAYSIKIVNKSYFRLLFSRILAAYCLPTYPSSRIYILYFLWKLYKRERKKIMKKITDINPTFSSDIGLRVERNGTAACINAEYTFHSNLTRLIK